MERTSVTDVGRLAPLLLLLVLVALLYGPDLGTAFVGDDLRLLDAVAFRSVPAALVTPDPIGDAFRPVGRQLYFCLVARLGGSSPQAAHAANLALFLISLGLLAWITRRLAGPYAAALAVGLLGLSYAADVTVVWASGAQHLLGLVFALAAIALTMSGATVAAGIALLLGLLSHESVVLAPLIAVLAMPPARDPRATPPKRWPLFAAVGIWLLLWLGAWFQHRVASPAGLGWDGVPAAFVHLLQIALGVEWSDRGGPGFNLGVRAIATVGIATLAIVWASVRRRGKRGPSSSRADRLGTRGLVIGLVWAVAGTLPAMVGVSTWSAHHFLFGLCGAFLLAGAWAAGQARWVGPTLVAVLALCSQNTRGLGSAAASPGAWTTASHVNRHSLTRDMGMVARYTGELRRLRADLPGGSVLFFDRVPGFWQVGGGRLVRHAYGDSTLRAYDFTAFSLDKVRSSPAYFFGWDGTALRELAPADLRGIAVASLRSAPSRRAFETLTFAARARPDDWLSTYWLTWVEWSRGDTAAALAHLRQLGMRARAGEPFAWEGSWSQRTLAAGDSAGSIDLLNRVIRRRALDPEPHRRLAPIVRARGGSRELAEVEAYAARVLQQRPGLPRANPDPTASRID